MRALILVAVAALGLAACGSTDQTDNALNINQNLFSEESASNDVTAIDAVTGEAANMAANVNYINAVGNETANGAITQARASTNRATTPRTPAPGKPPLEQPAPATPPPATTNNTAG